MVKKSTRWLAAKLIKDHKKTNDLMVRSRYGMLEGWISIVGNILLFVIKLGAGLSINSISLIADAIHTLADSITSAVVIAGFKMSTKPADKEHPFGHGRIESIATLIIATLLFVAGFELLHHSVSKIFHPTTSRGTIPVILLITGTMILKEIMARFSYELGEIIDSKALMADALHHRSDVFATGLVVVALIASRFGYDNIDGVMGVMVSFVIFYSAWSIARDAVTPLLGEAPSEELLETIEKTALENPDVFGVHDIIYHKYGCTCVVSLHLEVSDSETAVKLHRVSEEVEEKIAKVINGTVVAHIDPINRNHPLYNDICTTIDQIISTDERIRSYHDLRIIGDSEQQCNVVFDIALDESLNEQSRYDIISSMEEKFHNKFPKMKTVVRANPTYSYNL